MIFQHNIDTRGASLALRILGKDVLPQVVADTLNETAESINATARHNLKNRHTLRNRFTLGSIRTSKARPKRDLSGYARVYSVSPYMAIHDLGGYIDNDGKTIPVPTEAARISGSHQRAKRRMYQLRNLANQLNRSGGDAFILAPNGRGRLREPGIFTRQRGRLRMLYNLARRRIRIRGTRWWSDAVKFNNPEILQRRFERNVKRRLRLNRASR